MLQHPDLHLLLATSFNQTLSLSLLAVGFFTGSIGAVGSYREFPQLFG